MDKVLERNEVIAEFMGGEFKTDLPYSFTKSGWVNTPANHNKTIAQNYDLLYHSEWNWLMPVWSELIKKLGDKANSSYFEDCIKEDFYNALDKGKILKAYKAVIIGIEFYNKYK